MTVEKNCMFCNHLEFHGGGYGDYPDPDHLSCAKGHFKGSHWGGEHHVYDAADFRKIIIKAQTCPDYDQAKV